MLGVGTAGMMLVLPDLWVLKKELLTEPSAGPLVGIKALTDAIQKELELNVKGWGETSGHNPSTVGSVVNGVTMTNQKHIRLWGYPDQVFAKEEWVERVVRPGAVFLAQFLRTAGFRSTS